MLWRRQACMQAFVSATDPKGRSAPPLPSRIFDASHPLPRGAKACTHLKNRIHNKDLDDPHNGKIRKVLAAALFEKTRILRVCQTPVERCARLSPQGERERSG